MSTPPATFPQGTSLSYCIITGGHYYDPPSDQSGTAKVIDPIRHSQTIPYQEMPFITSLRSPTQEALETTPFPAEPGTVTAVTWQTGSPSTAVFQGIPNEMNNSGQDVGGNKSASYWADTAAKLPTNVKIPVKQTEEVEERGAVVRKKVEQGQEWMHNMTKGIATHAAWWPMAGQILSQVKQIETAVTQFASLPNMGTLSGLGGSSGASKAIANMNTAQMMVATGNMPATLKEGFQSMLKLMSESSAGKTYVSDGRVHESTFQNNAVTLLSQVRTESDLIEAFQTLRYDTSLHGLDQLPPITFNANTPFGNVVQTLDQNTGKISSNQDQMKKIEEMIKKFTSMLQQFEAGGKKNSKLFAGKEQKVAEMLGRLPGQKGQNRQQLVNQVKSFLDQNKQHKIAEHTKQKNPFQDWPLL
jgi:hypothetical protein